MDIKSKHAVAALQGFRNRIGTEVEPGTNEYKSKVNEVLSWVFVTELGTPSEMVEHFTNKLCNNYHGDIFELYLSFDSEHEKRFVEFLK